MVEWQWSPAKVGFRFRRFSGRSLDLSVTSHANQKAKVPQTKSGVCSFHRVTDPQKVKAATMKHSFSSYWWMLALSPFARSEYIVVGVSGGLQDGFPEHPKMDHVDTTNQTTTQAVFLGRALVRGYKSYLDVMEPSFRQYVEEPEQPLINCNLIPTGCWEHANEYWMYAVDVRQFIAVLMNEPRFLSIAPDLGLVDLHASETSRVVRTLSYDQIKRQNKTDTSAIAFPIVTAAWFNVNSHVPAPILYTKEDGTQVTNFPQSLAIWANTNFTDESYGVALHSSQADVETYTHHLQATYWDKIRASIRRAEASRPVVEPDRPTWRCQSKARFGVSQHMARVNQPYSSDTLQQILQSGGYAIDFEEALVTKVGQIPV